MESLEPLINLLAVLTVLSIASERATNAIKLQSSALRDYSPSPQEEKRREQRITNRNLFVGMGLAVIVKANIFEILKRLDAPWETLGWVNIVGSEVFRDPALTSWTGFLVAFGGSVITGVALGFGSKFWHDILDSVLELRGIAKQVRVRREIDAGNLAKAGKKGDR